MGRPIPPVLAKLSIVHRHVKPKPYVPPFELGAWVDGSRTSHAMEGKQSRMHAGSWNLCVNRGASFGHHLTSRAHIQSRSEPSFSFSDHRWSMPAHCAVLCSSFGFQPMQMHGCGNIMRLLFFLFLCDLTSLSRLSSRPTPGRGGACLSWPLLLFRCPCRSSIW